MLQSYINIDSLSKLMIGLIIIISSIIITFSRNYMRGDRKYCQFFVNLSMMIFSIIIMVISDHILLFLTFWCCSNFFLVKLMTHKREWKMAKNAGNLAFKNFIFGAIFIAVAFFIFNYNYNSYLISEINAQAANENLQGEKFNIIIFLALIFLLLGAMTQSAIMPFHKWLLSSLNSPTPVSAIMHAGLVNGGGFLIVRFAPIFTSHSSFLNIVFVIGIISGLVGTLFKLMQTDIKRMLASSTLSQMGFMIAQCGLGLFSAAIAHLCWHGLFKAYLFLSSASCVYESRVQTTKKVSFSIIVFALICGTIGAFSFAFASNKDISSLNSNYILITLAFLASSQLALNTLKENVIKFAFPAMVISLICGFIYGFSIKIIDYALKPANLSVPQDLNLIHIISLLVMFVFWIMVTFRANFRNVKFTRGLIFKIYVKSLNASKPAESTITSYRNYYKF